MRNVLFVFDRVAHYHRDFFRALEKKLSDRGINLILLSGSTRKITTGRTGLNEAVLDKELKYHFFEHCIKSYTLRFNKGVIRQIIKIKPEIVVVMGHVGNISYWLLMCLKKLLNFKLVAWQCGYEYNPGKFKDKILRLNIPRFDHHLAYHTNAAKYAMKYGAKRDSVTIINNTINERRIFRVPKEKAIRILNERYPQIGSKKIVLFVGAILAEKRIELLLEATAQLHAKDVMIIIVGNGPHLDKIREQCKERNDVIITGEIIEGVGLFFDVADVYVLPGTGGLGINEAMAHGLPIISGYADGSADDLVLDGKNGYRLRSYSIDELKIKLNLVLNEPEIAFRFGEYSRKLIEERFSFNRFVETVANTLTKI